MNTERNDHLNPRSAMEQARRVEAIVHRRGRWHGWVWLTLGFATPVFLIGTNANWVPGDAQIWIAIAFMTLGGVLAIWEHRRGLWGREAAKTDRPFTWAYIGAIVAFAVPTIVIDPTGAPLWTVILAFVPSIPCFMAAWRILER